jgi:hypothetical protein
MMTALSTTETPLLTSATRRDIPEDAIFLDIIFFTTYYNIQLRVATKLLEVFQWNISSEFTRKEEASWEGPSIGL